MRSKKKGLWFLLVTALLVIASIMNVFAGTTDWTCTESYNTIYSVGDVIPGASYIDISADSSHSESCTFESNYKVKAGDNLHLSFGTCFAGNKNKFDGTASICRAVVYAENGTKLADVSYELNGYQTTNYGKDDVKITDATAGKLKLTVYLENTGTNGVSTLLEELFVEVNGNEI